jgi:hypothetical protein
MVVLYDLLHSLAEACHACRCLNLSWTKQQGRWTYEPSCVRGEVIREPSLCHKENLGPKHLVLQELQVVLVHEAFWSENLQQLLKLTSQHCLACKCTAA